MDILSVTKQHLDAFLCDILDSRIILFLVRLASLYLNAALLLIMGRHLWKPTTFFFQLIMAIIAMAITFATPIHGVLMVSRQKLLWVVSFTLLLIVFCPALIAGSLSPRPRVQARIARSLWLAALFAFIAQSIYVLVSR